MKENFERLKNATVKFEADSTEANGPSSGIGLAATIISAVINVAIRNWKLTALTGKIRANGAIEKIGGAQAKAIACVAAGVKMLYIASDNMEEFDAMNLAARSTQPFPEQ